MRFLSCFFLIVLLILLSISCRSVKPFSSDNVQIQYLEKETRGIPSICIEIYDYQTKKKWLGYIEINDIVVQWDSCKDVGQFIVDLRPGNHNLKISFVDREEIKLKKIKISEGDSTVIKAYLKHKKETLYDQKN